MSEFALIIFTLCLQGAIGVMIYIAAAKIFKKDANFKVAALVAAILAVVGVLASLLHLGQPLGALSSLAKIGNSWLSREILFSGAFAGLTVVYAILLFLKSSPKGLAKVVAFAAAVVGIIDIFMMAQVYAATSIPAWQGMYTHVDFLATTLILGAVIFMVTTLKEQTISRCTLAAVAFIAITVQVAFAVPYYINLASDGAAALQSLGILQASSALMLVKWLLSLGGIGLLLCSARQEKLTLTYLGAVAVLIGLVLSRYLFYAALVATKVGLI